MVLNNLDKMIQEYNDQFGVNKKTAALVKKAEDNTPAKEEGKDDRLNTTPSSTTSVENITDKLVSKIDEALRDIEPKDTAEIAKAEVESTTESASVKEPASKAMEKNESPDGKEGVDSEKTVEENKEETEKKAAIKAIVATSVKQAKLEMARRLIETKNLEKLAEADPEFISKVAATNPKMLAALATILGIGGLGGAAYAYGRPQEDAAGFYTDPMDSLNGRYTSGGVTPEEARQAAEMTTQRLNEIRDSDRNEMNKILEGRNPLISGEATEELMNSRALEEKEKDGGPAYRQSVYDAIGDRVVSNGANLVNPRDIAKRLYDAGTLPEEYQVGKSTLDRLNSGANPFWNPKIEGSGTQGADVKSLLDAAALSAANGRKFNEFVDDSRNMVEDAGTMVNQFTSGVKNLENENESSRRRISEESANQEKSRNAYEDMMNMVNAGSQETSEKSNKMSEQIKAFEKENAESKKNEYIPQKNKESKGKKVSKQPKSNSANIDPMYLRKEDSANWRDLVYPKKGNLDLTKLAKSGLTPKQIAMLAGILGLGTAGAGAYALSDNGEEEAYLFDSQSFPSQLPIQNPSLNEPLEQDFSGYDSDFINADLLNSIAQGGQSISPENADLALQAYYKDKADEAAGTRPVFPYGDQSIDPNIGGQTKLESLSSEKAFHILKNAGFSDKMIPMLLAAIAAGGTGAYMSGNKDVRQAVDTAGNRAGNAWEALKGNLSQEGVEEAVRSMQEDRDRVLAANEFNTSAYEDALGVANRGYSNMLNQRNDIANYVVKNRGLTPESSEGNEEKINKIKSDQKDMMDTVDSYRNRLNQY